MQIELRRIDAWVVKGFDGITNLMIQRSQSKVPEEFVRSFEEAFKNLEASLPLMEDTVQPESDAHLFSALLQLSNILLARVRADKSFDGASKCALMEYMRTLKTALKRMQA